MIRNIRVRTVERADFNFNDDDVLLRWHCIVVAFIYAYHIKKCGRHTAWWGTPDGVSSVSVFAFYEW